MTTISNRTFEFESIGNVNRRTYSSCIFQSTVTFHSSFDTITFSGCTFNHTIFQPKTVLKNINFDNCIVNGNFNFTECSLDKVGFKNTSVVGAIFTSATLNNMNLSSLNLSSANFRNASIQNTSINNTNLSNSILTNVSARNLIGNTTLLPSDWKIVTSSIKTTKTVSRSWGRWETITETITNNILVGPSANLKGFILNNLNLDHLNLYGINLTGAKITNTSVQGTILDGAILKVESSSGITGTPKSLPIGSVIYNKQFYYTQDNIYLPKIENLNPIMTSINPFSPIIFSIPNKNLIYSGSIQNSEQHLILYLSQEYIDPSAITFQSNTIYIVSVDTNTILSTIEIPNFLITSLTAQPTKYGKGGMLIGYGYHLSISEPLKYITIRLDPNLQLDTLYESVGYEIQEIDNHHYPSGHTEMIQNSSTLYYLTQSNMDQMVISKMNFDYLVDCSGINFSGKNLSGTDLSGRNFTNCDFSGTNLSYCNFTNANFTNANLYKTNLSYSILSDVTLTGATFYQPNFTGIYLSSSTADFVLPNGFKFVNNYFIGPGLNLEGIDLSGMNLNNVNFQGSSLRNSILTNTKIWGTNFNNCILDNVTSGRVIGTPILPSSNKYKIINGFIVGPYLNLANANLSKQNLNDMNLIGTNMTGADLSGSTFDNVSSGDIKGIPNLSTNAKLINGYLIASGSLVSHSDLSGGDLSGVDLNETLLTNTNFYNVRSRNITGDPILSPSYDVRNGYLLGPYVDMSGVDLSGVDINGLSLYGANLSGTDLRYARLQNVSSGDLRGIPILDPKYKLLNGYIVGPNVDLSGANLSDVDLSGMDLTNTNLQNVIFTNLRSGFIKGEPVLSQEYRLMNGYIVGKELYLNGANLEWQDFSDMDLYKTDFTNVKLNHTTFNRSFILETNFTDIEFSDIRSRGLLGVPSHLPDGLIILDCHIEGSPSRIFVGPSIKLENIEFRNQNIDEIDLSGSQLINLYFNNTSIDSTNFNQTNLLSIRSKNITGTPLHLSHQFIIRNGYLIGPNVNLMSSDFTNLDLSGTNLTDANLLGVRFQNTTPGPIDGIPILDFDWKLINLKIGSSIHRYIIGPGMNLSSMDLSGQNLTNMNLTNTNLEQTILSNAILRNVSSGGIIGTPASLPSGWVLLRGYLIGPTANLSGANLQRANLTNMNLRQSNLSTSNLTGADLTGVDLTGVRSGGIQGTPILPVGWRIVNGYLIGPGADVTDTDLSGADLSGIDLSGTKFSRSNLTNVDLTNTNITNATFMGANLTNIIPASIYDLIDLTGAIMPSNNYMQYNHLISKNISMSDFLSMKYKELKQRIFNKIFSGQDIRKDISISSIKRLNLKLYDDLYILYSESANGNKDPLYFDQLTLLDIDTRFQMYQRTLTLISNMTYIDEFLLRLMNRFDIETIPEMILRNINFSLVLPETAAMFYMKHLFDSRFHSMILSIPSILERVENFFRRTSKIYDDNLFVKNLYGVTNNSMNHTYENIVKKYRYQVEIFENYLYVNDIVDKYTSASKISTLFRKMVDLNPKYVTPVVLDLFKKETTILFGPLSQRDDFDLYKLNENRLFISYEYEKHLVTEFISKNPDIVQSMFVVEKKLGQMWEEFKKPKADIHIIRKIYSLADTLENTIVIFRTELFSNIKNMSYTYVYPKDITETVLTMRENKLDSLVNMSDENIEVVSEYLKDNTFVKRILQDPKQFIKDIESPSFSSVEDITKLYPFSLYTTPQMKEKIIKYDIRVKLQQDEERYVSLFAGLSTDLRGDENLVAPLEEYRRIWNIIMM